jgi:hypothetical protein
MKVGIFFVFRDYHRRGRRNRMSMQPQIGPFLAGLLPDSADIEVVNETWEELPWHRKYDLVFISAMHSDFDRARQVSHYWRMRGAKTVFGGYLATTHPHICAQWFDAVVSGDPEANVPRLYNDFVKGTLKPLYAVRGHDPSQRCAPRSDLIAGKARHALALEATRGCPYVCEFCVITGVGDRYYTRDIPDVLKELSTARDLMKGKTLALQRRILGFTDNNLAGNPAWFRELCKALTPLGLLWYAAVTFNVIADPNLVTLMARSGCRVLFVGLESFNPAMLKNMRKHQNAIHKVKEALRRCREAGILVVSGMMVSPLTDDVAYIRRLPEYLSEAGLRVPTFLCFESPIPGTPHFNGLARAAEPAFMPGASLHDFTGYTLTVRPRRASVEEFVDAYRESNRAIYAWSNRMRKIVEDVPMLLRRGGWFPAFVDLGDMLTLQNDYSADNERTWVAGTDLMPPERVPLLETDFRDEVHASALLTPTAVTDEHGSVYDIWIHAGAIPLERNNKRSGALKMALA